VPISFDDFQRMLAIAMVVGLLVLVLPLLRIVKWAGLPLISVLLILVPLINVAWLFFVATCVRLPPSSPEEP
jgi:hypothetical protein